MQESRLFLGFSVDRLYEEKLRRVPPDLVDYYLCGGSYLSAIDFNGMRFLGKKLPGVSSVDDIGLLSVNIYSILKKLVPDFPYRETSLYLFSLL